MWWVVGSILSDSTRKERWVFDKCDGSSDRSLATVQGRRGGCILFVCFDLVYNASSLICFRSFHTTLYYQIVMFFNPVCFDLSCSGSVWWHRGQEGSLGQGAREGRLHCPAQQWPSALQQHDAAVHQVPVALLHSKGEQAILIHLKCFVCININ